MILWFYHPQKLQISNAKPKLSNGNLILMENLWPPKTLPTKPKPWLTA